jgi:tellurite methyltransferase
MSFPLAAAGPAPCHERGLSPLWGSHGREHPAATAIRAGRPPSPGAPARVILASHMPEGDREKWNARYEAEQALAPPSPFLADLDAVLPRRGRALDVGGGSGRNALWLARRGLEVTLADVSDVALERAAGAARAEGLALTTVRIDLEAEPLPPGPWDLILCAYFLHRPLFAAFTAALAPGGWLLVAHSTRSNLQRHPRPGPDHVLEDGELPTLIQGLEVVRYEEGWLESGRHEARIVARRPEVEPRRGP